MYYSVHLWSRYLTAHLRYQQLLMIYLLNIQRFSFLVGHINFRIFMWPLSVRVDLWFGWGLLLVRVIRDNPVHRVTCRQTFHGWKMNTTTCKKKNNNPKYIHNTNQKTTHEKPNKINTFPPKPMIKHICLVTSILFYSALRLNLNWAVVLQARSMTFNPSFYSGKCQEINNISVYHILQ